MADLNSKIESAKEKVRWCRVLDGSLGGLLASNSAVVAIYSAFLVLVPPKLGHHQSETKRVAPALTYTSGLQASLPRCALEYCNATAAAFSCLRRKAMNRLFRRFPSALSSERHDESSTTQVNSASL